MENSRNNQQHRIQSNQFRQQHRHNKGVGLANFEKSDLSKTKVIFQGGRHVDYIAEQLAKALNEVIKKKNKTAIEIKPFHVWLTTAWYPWTVQKTTSFIDQESPMGFH